MDQDGCPPRMQPIGVGEELNVLMRVFVNGVFWPGVLCLDIQTVPPISMDQLVRGEVEGIQIFPVYSLLHNNGTKYPIHPREIRSVVNARGTIYHIDT